MPIRDSLLDAVGFGGAGQLAHQLEGKRDRAAEAVAGGDAAVYDDFFIVDDGTGQLVLKSGVAYRTYISPEHGPYAVWIGAVPEIAIKFHSAF